eukprot:gene7335-biopygen21037
MLTTTFREPGHCGPASPPSRKSNLRPALRLWGAVDGGRARSVGYRADIICTSCASCAFTATNCITNCAVSSSLLPAAVPLFRARAPRLVQCRRTLRRAL